MDGSFLKDEVFREKIHKIWEQGSRNFFDANPRVQWDILWKCIKQKFREERNKRKELRNCISENMTMLQQLIVRMATNQGPDLVPILN